MTQVSTPEDARRVVGYWAEEGATWFKAYTEITRAELGAVIDEAHRRGLHVTGHLCSVSFREAVELGIDNLEHGFFTNTDYEPDKPPDTCPTEQLPHRGNLASPTDERGERRRQCEGGVWQAGDRHGGPVDGYGSGTAMFAEVEVAVNKTSNQTAPDRLRRRRRPRGDAELGEDAGDVGGGGAAADEERLADLAVGLAGDEEGKHFELARTQGGEDRWGIRDGDEPL